MSKNLRGKPLAKKKVSIASNETAVAIAKYHRWMRRMVRGEMWTNERCESQAIHNQACRIILAKLKARSK